MCLVLIIDNYDSFVYNIAQILGELGCRPIVVRNDEISVSGIERMRPDAIIISPGPGSPENRRDVGISVDAVRRLAGRVPMLGICLGHQAVGYAFGARIRRSVRVTHGKTRRIKHFGSPIYAGVPVEFDAMCYNSLVIDDVTPVLRVNAIDVDTGEVMGVEHVDVPVYGVQFHPESIGTRYGKRILRNFIDIAMEFKLQV